MLVEHEILIAALVNNPSVLHIMEIMDIYHLNIFVTSSGSGFGLGLGLRLPLRLGFGLVLGLGSRVIISGWVQPVDLSLGLLGTHLDHESRVDTYNMGYCSLQTTNRMKPYQRQRGNAHYNYTKQIYILIH